VLGLLWWAWVGYAWLTSVVDPDEGVRLVVFAAMAALVTSLCVPDAFGDLGLTLAIAYGAVRAAHIALVPPCQPGGCGVPPLRRRPRCQHGDRCDDPDGRLTAGGGRSVGDVGGGARVRHGRPAVHRYQRLAACPRPLRGATRAHHHRGARRVKSWAIGVGAEAGVNGGVIAAATLGIAVACAFWWTYFDVAALMAARRLAEVESVKVRNEIARDGFSYLHQPMVSAIVLVTLGMKVTLTHVGDPLDWEAAPKALA